MQVMQCCARVRGAECHCGRCHQTFGTLALFDAHQDRDYSQPPTRPPIICRDPATMGVNAHGDPVRAGGVAKLAQDGRGTWHTPAGLKARERSVGQLARTRSTGGSP
jgi:hypothetical protein